MASRLLTCLNSTRLLPHVLAAPRACCPTCLLPHVLAAHWLPARLLLKDLLEARSHLFVDMRSAKAYDYEHVTKPAKMTVNVPYEHGSMDEFVGELKMKFSSPSAKLLLVDETGEDGIMAAELLRESGYAGVHGVVGGYATWLKHYTTTGRRRIQGKFISTGREALKSGLDLDPAVASTYEENHGKVDLSLPSNRGLNE